MHCLIQIDRGVAVSLHSYNYLMEHAYALLGRNILIHSQANRLEIA